MDDLAFHIANPKSLNLSDPGTGKTPTVCVLAYYHWAKRQKRTLWVMPKSLLQKNKEEFQLFTGFAPEEIEILESNFAPLTKGWSGPAMERDKKLRSMKLRTADGTAIGDPHLGRRFERGVPLHRRGHREALQLAQFRNELNAPNVDRVVVMGDLFDHPHVGFHVVLSAYEAMAASVNDIILLTGNHDEPRNLKVVSAIDVMAELLAPLEHVHVVRRNAVQIGNVAVFPWDWTSTAEEQVAQFVQTDEIHTIAGHWDMMSFGGDDSHIAPTKALSKFGAPIYSGHYHIPGDYEIDGHIVHCTGSMQPYSHGEDPEGALYVTLTLDELEDQDLSNKCVRVLLKEGEELPTDLDCLALTSKRVSHQQEERDIQLDTFSWKDILDQALEPLPPHVQNFITDKMKEYDSE